MRITTALRAPVGAKSLVDDVCRQSVLTVMSSACCGAIIASTARVKALEKVKTILQIEEAKTSGLWRLPQMTSLKLLEVESMARQVTCCHQLTSDTTFC